MNVPRNVPRNVSRYKDLVPIDIAEESIRKLTFIPRKGRSTKSRVFNLGPKKEPRVMDLYPLVLWKYAMLGESKV